MRTSNKGSNMKVSITRDELFKAVTTVIKGMSSRSTLPILSGILLVAYGKQIELRTTDLEISIKRTAVAFVEEEGQIVVPGKLFSDIIKRLPDAAVQLTLVGERLRIGCLESSFEISTLNAVDFPQFPSINPTQEIVLPVARVSNMVKHVYRATSKDEHRLILTGINLKVDGNNIALAATDSYRLAVSNAVLSEKSAEPFELVIGGHLFEEIIKLANDADEIHIGTSENQIMFSFGDTVFVSRKIEGRYPNYNQLIPSDRALSAVINTSDFEDAVKRVSLLAQSNSSIKFTFSSADQKVIISSQTQDVGNASEDVAAQIEGEDLEIAFNHQFIVDGLASVTTETVIFEAQATGKPGIFRAAGGENSMLYLVMPVRIP